MLVIIGGVSLVAWIYLMLGRGGFWRVREEPVPAVLSNSKSVAIIIPARNEEAVIGEAVESLLNQDYPGRVHLFVVDDHSSDATATAAGVHQRLSIVRASPLPQGWTGKLWAISEGLRHAQELNPDFILLTDADIVHGPGNVGGLVARAESRNLDLASYMVKLQCRTFPERALIPAFVYFFFQLYPPSWTRSAAGGCILVRPRALARIGGIASIRGELIDDCALARYQKGWQDLAGSNSNHSQHSRLHNLRRNTPDDFAHRIHAASPFHFASVGNDSGHASHLCRSASFIIQCRSAHRNLCLAGMGGDVHHLYSDTAFLQPVNRLGTVSTSGRTVLHLRNNRFRDPLLDRQGWRVERSHPRCVAQAFLPVLNLEQLLLPHRNRIP
jgi:glycosyltransferase involved in cell wall biosynthesis